MLIHTNIRIILNRKTIIWVTLLISVHFSVMFLPMAETECDIQTGMDFYNVFHFCLRAELSIYWLSYIFILHIILHTSGLSSGWTILFGNTFDRPSILLGKSENTVCHSYRIWEYSRDLSSLLLRDTKCTLDV